MTDNPYEAPQTTSSTIPTAIGVLSGSREDLRSVAKSQKGILICILINIIMMVGQFFLPPDIRPFLGIVLLVVSLAGSVFTIMLAIKVYGTGLGIVLGILTLIPLIGLIVLLIVNQKATGILQQNGIKVGLLGANLSKI